MWRLDGLQRPYVVRLGQAFVQLWQRQGKGWELLGSAPAHHIQHDQHQALSDLVMALVQDLPAASAVQVVADSKWMPVSLLQTGRHPLSAQQVQALAQHRFAEVFGQEARSWTVQTSYVSGDACALAFACPTSLHAGVQRGLGLDIQGPREKARIKLKGLQPTLTWLWQQSSHHLPKMGAWLVIVEHDRSLMAWISNGKLQALQPAAPPMQSLQSHPQLTQLLKAEALRCGLLNENASALALSFETLPLAQQTTPVEGVQWHAMQLPESAP